MILIRPILPDEMTILDDFLYEAIFVPQGVDPPPHSIIENSGELTYRHSYHRSEAYEDMSPHSRSCAVNIPHVFSAASILLRKTLLTVGHPSSSSQSTAGWMSEM